MRNYEVGYIVHPDLEESAYDEVLEKVKGWITEGGGNILNVDVWGKRRLAYQIIKQTEGHYVFILADIEPTQTADLERNFGLEESIMRFMITSAIPAIPAAAEKEAEAE